MTTDELREQPAVQGLVQVAHNALDRINALEHEVSVLKTALFQAQEAAKQLAKQPEQEPVAWQWLDTGTFRKSLPSSAEPGAWNPLYTTPPRREWVGLDRKEMFAIIDQEKADLRTGLPMFWRDQVAIIARAIEAKLKEKNQCR